MPSISNTTGHAPGSSYLVHRGAPEIIEEYVYPGRVRAQISVVLNGTNIIENETTMETVMVANNTREHHDSTKHVL